MAKPLIKPISIKYDKEEDILYLYFSKNRPAVTIELEDDSLLRIDPKTHELISLEVLFFSKLSTKSFRTKPISVIGSLIPPPHIIEEITKSGYQFI